MNEVGSSVTSSTPESAVSGCLSLAAGICAGIASPWAIMSICVSIYLAGGGRNEQVDDASPLTQFGATVFFGPTAKLSYVTLASLLAGFIFAPRVIKAFSPVNSDFAKVGFGLGYALSLLCALAIYTAFLL